VPCVDAIARSDLKKWSAGAHGSTFGGNPVACAAAIATLDLVEDSLTDNAAVVGDLLMGGLRELQARQPLLTEIRGRGLMIGIDFPDHDPAAAVEQACFRRGLLVLTGGERAIRFAPALTITAEQAETAVAILEDACADVAH
jgi:4-aminobutyrate aminotransferase